MEGEMCYGGDRAGGCLQGTPTHAHESVSPALALSLFKNLISFSSCFLH